VQDLYATSFRVAGADNGELYAAAAGAASRWAWRGAGAPPDVFEEAAGERDVGNGYGMTWAEISVPDRVDRALTVTLRHPDPQVGGREWRTVVDICRRAESVSVTVRVAREAVELRMTPAALTTLRRPGLIPELLNKHACYAGGLDLKALPAVIHVSAVEDFVETTLRNAERALPVVVLAPSTGRPSAPDPGKVADELAGLAHVAQLGGHLAWRRFRETVGDALFIPAGGVRIFWPGFGTEGDQLHHRYWTHRAIEALHLPVQRMLFALLTRVSVHAVPLDRLPSELRHASAEARLKELAATGRTDAELLELYAQENEGLRERVERLEAENVERERELTIHRQNYAAMAAAGALEEAEDEETEADALDGEQLFEPQSWSEFLDNVDALESSAFTITPNAREGCNPSAYPDPARMWWHLERLAEAAEAWAEQNCAVGMDLKTWIQHNYGIEIALFDGSLGDRASFIFDGEDYSREPHVKVDDYKGPDECGRIYFAYVAEEQRFIVDHIGLHL